MEKLWTLTCPWISPVSPLTNEPPLILTDIFKISIQFNTMYYGLFCVRIIRNEIGSVSILLNRIILLEYLKLVLQSIRLQNTIKVCLIPWINRLFSGVRACIIYHDISFFMQPVVFKTSDLNTRIQTKTIRFINTVLKYLTYVTFVMMHMTLTSRL